MIGKLAAGIGAVVLALAAGASDARQGPAPAADSCAPGSKLQYVCGITKPEDLVQIPGSDWIIVSNLADPKRPGSGGLTLLNGRTRTAARATLAEGRVRAPYAACPGPLDPTRFSGHGLSIRPAGRGRATLFVVGHGAREAVEIFDVDATRGTPTLNWVGCVMGPGGSMNSLAAMPDGRIVVTEFNRPPMTLIDALQGKITGAVWVWKPGGAFEKLAGTDLPGPNGVEVSRDGRHLFVAVTGTSTVLRYKLANTSAPPDVVKTEFRTDNLRWAPDGRLLLAGPGPQSGCTPAAGKACPLAPVVAALGPKDLKVEVLLQPTPEPAFPGLSSALITGRTLWLGTYQVDRIGWLTLDR